jgi:hypothetical protein
MEEDGIGRAALKLWLREHSPITVEKDKFRKLKKHEKGFRRYRRMDENGFDVPGALRCPFWNFAPKAEHK